MSDSSKGRALTAERLRSELGYDPESGKFVRLAVTTNATKVGAEAGTVKSHGYVAVSIAGYQHYAHRLVWLYVHGRWPAGRIDHINGDRTDNRLCNLREVSASENMQNQRKASKRSKAGLLGVSWHDKVGAYFARIQRDGKQIWLGNFATPEEASAAYWAAKRSVHLPVPQTRDAAIAG